MTAKTFPYRGFMLDVSRHFMPVEHVERLIEAAAVCGMNRMHWHLTDDQGGRVQIRRYPELTAIGATRGWSFFGNASGLENNCGFYTQADIRRVVAFARAHGIEIIPEIELPGHASALLAALPQCGCRLEREDGTVVDHPYRYEVIRSAGIFPNLVCAGSDAAMRVIEDILDEIVALFPFPMVHIGGDEAPKLRWRRCPDCQRRMREAGIASEDALQRQLVLDVGEYLSKKGRRTVVWNDVLAGGPLPSHFVVQQWLGDAPLARDFLASGGQLIVSDTRHYYFDYPYGITDVHAVWDHPMIPEYARGYEANLLGVECPLWTEYVTNIERAAFQLLPRMAAVGLRAGGDDSPDWPTFRDRVRAVVEKTEALGLRGGPEALWHMTAEAAGADRAAFQANVYAQGAQPLIEWQQRLVTLEKAERLMEKLGLPRAFRLRAGNRAIPEYCELPLRGQSAPAPEAFEGDDGALTLATQMMQAVENRESGPWAGLPEDVFIDTMKAFTRFVSEHRRSTGRDGFDRGFWTTRQVGARLFRIGELEYELCEDESGPYMSLHIPSDARLEPDALNASADRARAFLAEHFLDWAQAPMRCDSWLLSPRLAKLLGEDSRIRRFAAAFDLTEEDPDDRGYLEWVFALTGAQARQADADALPEDTALRRGAKAMLRRGEHIGSAAGVLARRFG